MIKTDPEERLKDARIHFIDAANDYQLGLASARDLSAETVRIADINAPIVMDRSFARFAAERLLERTVESDETLSFTLAGHRLDLEVGDYVSLPKTQEQWQIQSLEGLTTQRVSAKLSPQHYLLPLSGAIPVVTAEPLWAVKPVLLALDIPGPYEGPLVGAISDPFSAAVIIGPEADITVGSPVQMGALLTPLARGPIGRWCFNQTVDVLLPGAELFSLSNEAVLAGGNKFAVETQTGWEVFQAASAELVAPNTYRLSNLLRGLDGSEADMMELLSAGARVTVLGGGWQALPLSDAYIDDPISLSASAAGRIGDAVEFHYLAKHLRPLSPVHVKISISDGNRLVSWIRQSRIGGENWSGMEVPLGEESELYRVQCLSNGEIMSEYEVAQPHIILSQSDINMSDQIAISQGSRAYGWGTSAIIDIPSLA